MIALEERTKKSTVGLKPNGRINWRDRANKVCLALLRRGFGYNAISTHTDLTVGQICTRARLRDLSVMSYRRGESHEAIVILKRYKIVRGGR